VALTKVEEAGATHYSIFDFRLHFHSNACFCLR